MTISEAIDTIFESQSDVYDMFCDNNSLEEAYATLEKNGMCYTEDINNKKHVRFYNGLGDLTMKPVRFIDRAIVCDEQPC